LIEHHTEDEISGKVKIVIEQKKLNNKTNTISLESQTDQLVYQLYDLTAEEIKIIKNSVK